MLIFVTLSVRSRIVIVSLMRIGFSNRIIRLEIKLAKIFCKLKSRLISSAVISYCNFDYLILIIEKSISSLISISRYLVMVVMA